MKVGYFNLGRMGRLGNVFFEIFSTYGYSVKHGFSCYFNYVPVLEMLPNIKFNVGTFNVDHIMREEKGIPSFSITYNDFEKKDNVELYGFLQSYKYFENLDEKCFVYSCPHAIKDDLYEKITSEDSSFIHVRRGDYLNYPENLLDISYYYKAIKLMNVKSYFVFSDDIPFCKSIFSSFEERNAYDFFYIENENPYQDISLMSIMKNGILSNSSFSFWGARLNGKPIRAICPLYWFSSKNKIDTDDIVYPEWERIKDVKLDLIEIDVKNTKQKADGVILLN